MNLYLWFTTSSDFQGDVLPIIFSVWGTVSSCEKTLIRYTTAPSSNTSWFMRCVLIVLGGALSAYVFGGVSLLSAGLVLGLSSMIVFSLFFDRMFAYCNLSLSLLPAGTPVPLAGPVVALEKLSFFLRLATLAIRLMANILVGGIIVHLLFGNAGLIYVLAVGLFYAYEMMVFSFQLYLFGGLSLLYHNESPEFSDFCVS